MELKAAGEGKFCLFSSQPNLRLGPGNIWNFEKLIKSMPHSLAAFRKTRYCLKIFSAAAADCPRRISGQQGVKTCVRISIWKLPGMKAMIFCMKLEWKAKILWRLAKFSGEFGMVIRLSFSWCHWSKAWRPWIVKRREKLADFNFGFAKSFPTRKNYLSLSSSKTCLMSR